MNKLFLSVLLLTFSLYAEENNTKEINVTLEHNSSLKTEHQEDKNKTISKDELAEKQVKEQMAREAKYAKEQKFYQGDEYDLKAVEVNEKSLDNIPVIEPDYDFDITDVYRDDL
jgi:cell division protein FtsX